MSELITWKIGSRDLKPASFDPLDPRGQVLMWEYPKRAHTYVIGVDPTFGLSGWDRTLRTKDDLQKDNAAVEVYRKESDRLVQVAEYVAPIDAESLAPVCNMLGRLYGEHQEDGQALMCIEVYPGTGWMTQRELINRFGYTNLPPWLVEGGIQQRLTNKIGWHSSRSTRQDLWSRGVTYMNRGAILLRSPFLIDEMADCTPDSFLSNSARARVGLHDDRVTATLLCIWYGNEWTISIEPTESSTVQASATASWQASACSSEQMAVEMERKFSEILGSEF